MEYYGHFSQKHLRINNKVIIFGLTRLEYFDLKTKKIVKWKRYERAK